MRQYNIEKQKQNTSLPCHAFVKKKDNLSKTDIIWRKEIFYLTMHSTHFIYGYMASDIWVKDHSDSEKGNPLL